MKRSFLSIIVFSALALIIVTSCEKKASPASMSNDSKTYSIALRIRRVTYEDAYVAVPVTDAIMKRKEDGTMGIDFEKFETEAIRISKDPRVEWQVEESKSEPHQIQQAAPDGRKSFDAYYSETNSAKKD
jgi:hypothetical protein